MASAAFIAILAAGMLLGRAEAGAQYYYYNDQYFESRFTCEAGASAGGMNCLTDLGGHAGVGGKFLKDVNWNASRICGSLYALLNYECVAAVRIELMLGAVGADDHNLQRDETMARARRERNLHFRSAIHEASFLAEFHFLAFFSRNKKPRCCPYLLAGIGLFNFSPEAMYRGTWAPLNKLHTEGQGFSNYPERKEYRLTQACLPAGAGIKIEPSAIICFRAEITYRKLWTDYLDDVSRTYIDPRAFDRNLTPGEALLAKSLADRRNTPGLLSSEYIVGQRGNSSNNDAYFSFVVKAAVTLGRQLRK